MGRSPCSDKLRMKHEVLENEELGGRHGKSGRLMRKTSDCLKQSFTHQEEDLIIKLHATIGSRWFIIAQQIPGRTDIEVKNIWNTKLRKKLTAMGIDPVTHRPFSQILADYGNIGASPNANKSRFGSLTRNWNLKANSNMHTSETESYSSCIANFDLTRNPMISNNNDHNLLSQLESIKLVSESDSSYHNNTEYMSTHFNCNEFSSRPLEATTSESPSSSSNQGGESSRFNWIDFLLEDESPTGTIQEQVDHGNISRDMVVEEEINGEEDVGIVHMDNFEAKMPSSRSFVEDILENEHDFFSDFQGFEEDQFYY